MKIGEVAKIVGLSSSAIRFYERQGLLTSSGGVRTDNGYRVYGPKEVEEILLIVKFKELGLELDEIKNLLCEDAKFCSDLLTSLDAQLIKYRKMENLIQDRIRLLLAAKERCEVKCVPENNVKNCCN